MLRLYRGHTVPKDSGPYYAFYATTHPDDADEEASDGPAVDPGELTRSKPGEQVWGHPDLGYLSEDVFELIFPQLELHVPEWDPYGDMLLPPHASFALAGSLRAILPAIHATATRTEAKQVLHYGFLLGEFAKDPWPEARDTLCATLLEFAAWLEEQAVSGLHVRLLGI